MSLIFGLFSFGIVFLSLAGSWLVFEKAGKPGWAALIPFYNIVILLEIIGKPIWWLIMFFIPPVNLIFAVWSLNLLSKSFGKDEGFTVGLLFLPYVFLPILGFGEAEYQNYLLEGPEEDEILDSDLV